MSKKKEKNKTRKEKEKQYQESFQAQWDAPRNSEHHIDPSSRSYDDSPENKVLVNEELHQDFHKLFQNRTPHEILDFLVNYWWGGRILYLHTYLKTVRDSEELSFEYFLDRAGPT